eukprot:2884307-Rhodomonas_salina.5
MNKSAKSYSSEVGHCTRGARSSVCCIRLQLPIAHLARGVSRTDVGGILLETGAGLRSLSGHGPAEGCGSAVDCRGMS